MSRRTDTVLFLIVATLTCVGVVVLAQGVPSTWTPLQTLTEWAMASPPVEAPRASPSGVGPAASAASTQRSRSTAPESGPLASTLTRSDPLGADALLGRGTPARTYTPVAVPEPTLPTVDWGAPSATKGYRPTGSSPHPTSQESRRSMGRGIAASGRPVAMRGGSRTPSSGRSAEGWLERHDLDRLSGDLQKIGGHLAALDRSNDRAEQARQARETTKERAVTSNDTAPLPSEPTVPVDGGLGLLAAAGAAYAVRRLRADAAA